MELEYKDRLEVEGRVLLTQSLVARLLDADDDERPEAYQKVQAEFARLLALLRSC